LFALGIGGTSFAAIDPPNVPDPDCQSVETSSFAVPVSSLSDPSTRLGGSFDSSDDGQIPGPQGSDYNLSRTINSQEHGVTSHGTDTMAGDADMHLKENAGGTIDFVESANSKRSFDPPASGEVTYHPPADSDLALVHQPDQQQYQLTNEVTGEIIVFYDFSSSPELRGKPKERTKREWQVQDPPGQAKEGTVYIYDSNGYLVLAIGPEGADFAIEYQYSATYPEKIVRISAWAGAPGAGTEMQTVRYTYKDSSHSADLGYDGQLVLVESTELNSITRRKHYRYDRVGWDRLLRFLSPITTGRGPMSNVV
jgi:hypothetical protein